MIPAISIEKNCSFNELLC